MIFACGRVKRREARNRLPVRGEFG
jgi:hypothetical protein